MYAGGDILGASYKLPINMIIFCMQLLNMFIAPFITHSKIPIKYMPQIVLGCKYMRALLCALLKIMILFKIEPTRALH